MNAPTPLGCGPGATVVVTEDRGDDHPSSTTVPAPWWWWPPGIDEVHPVIRQHLWALIREGRAATPGGDLPGVDDPAWVTAPAAVRDAVLARVALAHLVDATETATRQRVHEDALVGASRLRLVSGDLADATNWSRIAERHVPADVLAARRGYTEGRPR